MSETKSNAQKLHEAVRILKQTSNVHNWCLRDTRAALLGAFGRPMLPQAMPSPRNTAIENFRALRQSPARFGWQAAPLDLSRVQLVFFDHCAPLHDPERFAGHVGVSDGKVIYSSWDYPWSDYWHRKIAGAFEPLEIKSVEAAPAMDVNKTLLPGNKTLTKALTPGHLLSPGTLSAGQAANVPLKVFLSTTHEAILDDLHGGLLASDGLTVFAAARVRPLLGVLAQLGFGVSVNDAHADRAIVLTLTPPFTPTEAPQAEPLATELPAAEGHTATDYIPAGVPAGPSAAPTDPAAIDLSIDLSPAKEQSV